MMFALLALGSVGTMHGAARAAQQRSAHTFTRAGILRTTSTAAAALLPSSPLGAVQPPNSPESQATQAPPVVRSVSSREATSLAKHLKERGVKMYGAYWCSNCNTQKQEFGASAAGLINYIECAEDGFKSERPSCRAKEVSSYPTWEVDGELFIGKRSLEELAVLSGFCDFSPGFCGSSTAAEVSASAKEVFR